MQSSLSIKIVITLTVVLLCAGAALYSFGRLHSVGERYDFDLYTLVPQNAVAVFETDRILDFYDSVERMHSSRDGHYLSVSEFFISSSLPSVMSRVLPILLPLQCRPVFSPVTGRFFITIVPNYRGMAWAE